MVFTMYTPVYCLFASAFYDELGASASVDMRRNSFLERNGESSRSGSLMFAFVGYQHPFRRTSALHSFEGRYLFTIIIVSLHFFSLRSPGNMVR